MNKYKYIMIACALMFWACGHSGNKVLDNDKSENASATHTHADGTECDHDHSSHGHSHASGEDGHSHAGHDHSHGGHSHVHSEGSGDTDEIIFPASQAARTDFKVEPVERTMFREVIKTSGMILPAQGDEVTLAAPAAGIVSFAGTALSDGVAVSTGQRLFYISSKNIASGDIIAKNAAAYAKAKADLERAESLLEDKIVSRKEYDAIKLDYEQAKVEYDALAAGSSGRGSAVQTPIGGYITGLSVTEGDYVEVGQPLAVVSQNRRLTLKAEVSQKYYNRLAGIQGANFTVPYEDKTYCLENMAGRKISVGKSSSSLIPVIFEFDNNGSVVAGSYVEVYLLGAPMAGVLTVPITALSEQQGLYYVYIRLDADCYQKREVMVGARDGIDACILSGLAEGEEVVTRGAVNVKMAEASGEIPHGHEH